MKLTEGCCRNPVFRDGMWEATKVYPVVVLLLMYNGWFLLCCCGKAAWYHWRKFLTFPSKYVHVTRPSFTFFPHNHQSRLTLQTYNILLGKINWPDIASLKKEWQMGYESIHKVQSTIRMFSRMCPSSSHLPPLHQNSVLLLMAF